MLDWRTCLLAVAAFVSIALPIAACVLWPAQVTALCLTVLTMLAAIAAFRWVVS